MMNTGKYVRFLLLSMLLPCLFAHSFGQKGKLDKYEGFYQQNASSIDSLVNQFEEIYAQRPCSIGFTDLSFRHFSMEVYSDSVRYIYNTSLSNGMALHKAVGFQYDSAQLVNLALRLYLLKGLWIGKTSFYKNGEKEVVTFLSFRQVKKGKLFAPEQYVIVLFRGKDPDLFTQSNRVKSGTLKQIGSHVFMTIGSGFR
jgi:hypothetical protein